MRKFYLMAGGTLLPAFVGLGVRSLIKKRIDFDTLDIILFAGLTVLGGYITSKVISN